MLPGSDIQGWARATGQRAVTLAFFNAVHERCEGGWPDDAEAVLAKARAFRSIGGRVIVSTGGWNADDLAERCADPAALADVYEGVLRRFQTDYLDLDAEPGDVHDNLKPAIVDRRSAAMRILQDRFAARGRRLHLSFTVAVRPAFGMDPANFYVLKSATAAGVRIEVVNAMIMDYRDGASGEDMGTRSVLALAYVQDQLKRLIPGLGERAAWGMIAATPMLGQNDAPEEVFTLPDARLLTVFAAQMGMARIAFWSLARDNGGCPGAKAAQPSCSGLAQAPWAFSGIFARFADAVGPPPRFEPVCRNQPSDETICTHVGPNWTTPRR
jgi:chitinase